MSLFTAFSLSLNNLLTKKARTILTSFAGSIGIIGIALILSLSTGFQNYIDKIQEDTLSSYPLTVTSETADATSMLLAMVSDKNEVSVKLATKQGNVVLDTKDGLKASLEGWETVKSASHTHANQTVLDGISAEKVAAWDAKQNAMTAITDAEINALFAEVTSL